MFKKPKREQSDIYIRTVLLFFEVYAVLTLLFPGKFKATVTKPVIFKKTFMAISLPLSNTVPVFSSHTAVHIPDY